MSVSNKIENNQVIFISGTPCTGKTTIASKLNEYFIENGFDSRLIKINDLAIEKNLVLGEDPDKFYKVIDIDRLDKVLNEEIDNFLKNDSSLDTTLLDSSDLDNATDSNNQNNSKNPKKIIAEGHLSHLCNGADKMIVLRLNPIELEKRLKGRDYSNSKINENLEAEALAVCSAEAYEIYGDETSEIDTTDKSIDEVLDIFLDIICEDGEYPLGSVDFMDWFLN